MAQMCIRDRRVISFLSGSSVSHSQFKKMCREMVHEFDTIPISDVKKPRVGIVGEILVKFLPAANIILQSFWNLKALRQLYRI